MGKGLPAYNPLKPLGPKGIKRQARAYVSSQIGPLIAQLNADFDRRSRAGQSSIATGTNALAAALSPAAEQTRGIYDRAQATQRSDDAALANRLSGLGQSSSNSLAAQLAQINAPGQQVQQVAGGAAQMGAGAGGASAAIGSSSLAALLAQGAAAQQYAGQLPNIARLGGAQRSSQLGQALESERSTQAGQIRSRIPGLVSGIEQQLSAQDFQKGLAASSGLVSGAKLQQQANQFDTRIQTTQRGQDITVRGQDLTAKAKAEAAHAKEVKAHTDAFWKIRGNAVKSAQALYKGTSSKQTTTPPGGGYAGPGSTSTTYVRVPRQEAYKRLHASYAPQLKGLGYTAAAIKQMLRRALNAAGYQQPAGAPQQIPGTAGRGPGGSGPR